MFRQVRDHFLLPVLSGLQLKKTHSMISVDGEVPGRPIEISWDAHLPSTMSWSETLGVVGFGMIVNRFWPHGDRKKVGAIQVAGVVLEQKAFMETPGRWYKQAKQSKTTKRFTVLTHQEWFLTSWGLWLLDHKEPDPDIYWHKVPETIFGIAVNKAFESVAPA